jgi:hypothetical protein
MKLLLALDSRLSNQAAFGLLDPLQQRQSQLIRKKDRATIVSANPQG